MNNLPVLLYILVSNKTITAEQADKAEASGLGDMKIPENWRDVENQVLSAIYSNK